MAEPNSADQVLGSQTRRGTEMTDVELSVVLNQQISIAVGYYTDKFARRRILAEQYYEANLDTMPAQTGRRKVIRRDVAESVDIALASLMKLFARTDDICRFIPQKPEDVQAAEQATAYVNFIFNVRNDGYHLMEQWMKRALLFRLGILKCYWDETSRIKEETYKEIREEAYQALMSDPLVEVLDVRQQADPKVLDLLESRRDLIAAQKEFMPPEQAKLLPDMPEVDEDQLPQVYTVHVKERTDEGRIKLAVVPPEEFLFASWTRDVRDRNFKAHRRRVSASELAEMGFDVDEIDVPFGDPGTLPSYQEKFQRFVAESSFPWAEGLPHDPSTRSCWLTEAYLTIDVDGDGVAEYRKIIAAGEGKLKILSNEIVDSHPFCVLTPITMPFKMVGQSIFDQTVEIQQIKTQLFRMALDNHYSSNNQRLVVNLRRAHFPDILNPKPGSPIRTDGPVRDAVMPLPLQPMAQEALNMLNYADQIRENRTGISRVNGLDPDTLQRATATQVQLQTNASNMRLEAIGRTFAETGFKDLCRRILALAVSHSTGIEQVYLRGSLVPMRPRGWQSNFDLVAQVGLGTGNRDQALGHMNAFVPILQQIVQMQGGVNGPLVTMKNIYSFLIQMCQYASLKNPEQYFSNPDQAPPPQPPQPPPELMIKQMELKERAREFDAKHALAARSKQGDFALKKAQLQQEYETRMADLEMDALREHHLNQNKAADRELSGLEIHHSDQQSALDREMESLNLHNQNIQAAHQRDLESLKLHQQQQEAMRNRAMNGSKPGNNQ